MLLRRPSRDTLSVIGFLCNNQSYASVWYTLVIPIGTSVLGMGFNISK
jgi:hypothetical protein